MYIKSNYIVKINVLNLLQAITKILEITVKIQKQSSIG
jgi:hypothetical protein